ncbi:hypothetical protein [Amycolatopsis anabasis]|uniref:hypothetical protein n=1 Tax=Amycolatopsis anabasis TaxID=1840409 RepID=UPI00131C010D|nr:hypothetical protein [Amycolatopsis anabasis]
MNGAAATALFGGFGLVITLLLMTAYTASAAGTPRSTVTEGVWRVQQGIGKCCHRKWN